MLVANCSDKTIRLYRLDEGVFKIFSSQDEKAFSPRMESLTPLSSPTKSNCVKFSDSIGRSGWTKVLVTPDGSLLVATSDKKDAHIIYLFDTLTGQIIHVLEDNREAALDVTVTAFLILK